MANKTYDFVIRGTVDWCKLLGAARPYSGDPRYDKGPSWSVEIAPDEKSMALLKQHGVADKLKTDKKTRADGTPTKNPRDYQFVRLTILENRADGSKNKNPEVLDIYDKPWDQEKEIGNGSVADVLVRVIDYGNTKGLYFRKMRVLKHVPYEGGSGFAPLSEDDEYFAGNQSNPAKEDTKGKAGNPDDLDDDIPF